MSFKMIKKKPAGKKKSPEPVYAAGTEPLHVAKESAYSYFSGQSKGNDNFELLKIARQGLSYEDFLKIMEFSGFSVKEWAIYVQLNERTLQRYKAENRPFEQIYSERILGIARLLQKGATLFGDMVVFEKWLSTENVALGKMMPKQLLDSTFGISILEDELTKIEHGVFA